MILYPPITYHCYAIGPLMVKTNLLMTRQPFTIILLYLYHCSWMVKKTEPRETPCHQPDLPRRICEVGQAGRKNRRIYQGNYAFCGCEYPFSSQNKRIIKNISSGSRPWPVFSILIRSNAGWPNDKNTPQLQWSHHGNFYIRWLWIT